MTTRTHEGLRFRVVSPSFWQLDGFPVELCYLGGSAAGDGWYIFTQDQKGEMRPSAVPSRDHALGMIAKAFRNIGQLQ